MILPKPYPTHLLKINAAQTAVGQNQPFVVTLENTETAVRIHFSDFQTLSEYLQKQVQAHVAL